MLRSVLVALAAAACLFAFAGIGELPGGTVARAIAGVAMGIAVTALAYGEATFATVALGAVSPLVFAAMERSSLAAAAAAMCALWLAPRFLLAETRRQLVVLVAVSIAAAGVAGWIFAAYVEAPMAAHAASCIFAGSCLSLVGVVIPVPTTTAYALRTAATAIGGPIHDALLRAAQAHESARWQPRATSARKQWRELVVLSDERAALQRASGPGAEEQRRHIDQRIESTTNELAPDPHGAGAPARGSMPSDVLPSDVPSATEMSPAEVPSGDA